MAGAPMDDGAAGEPAEQAIQASPIAPELEAVHESQPESTVRSTESTDRRVPRLIPRDSLRRVSRSKVVVGTVTVVIVLAAGSWVLASNFFDNPQPAALPDHTIVLNQEVNGNRRLVALDTRADGDVTPIAHTDGARAAALSPDRTRIAYFVEGSGAAPGVPYLIGSDGSGRRQLLSDAATSECPKDCPTRVES